MADTWYVVADGARAEVLRPRRQGFESLFHLTGPHPKTCDIVSDRPGRTGDHAGSARHSMEQETDPHRHLKDVFVRELAGRLEQGLQQGACDELVLVADPRTLGELRSVLGVTAQRAVAREVAKDLTPLGIKDLHLALGRVAKEEESERP